MTLHRLATTSIRTFTLLAALAIASVGSASSRELVSVDADNVNMRAGPSKRAEVLWQLGSGYPLEVLQRKGRWLRVVDFENDKGWVARSLTSTTPHTIVKSRKANLRAGPGTRHRVLGQASYGDVFEVLDKRKSWVQVQGEDDRKGWIARRLLWGR